MRYGSIQLLLLKAELFVSLFKYLLSELLCFPYDNIYL